MKKIVFIMSLMAVSLLTNCGEGSKEPKLITYTITYNNLFDSTTDNPTSYTSDDAFTFRNPTDRGYAFTGWHLDSEIGESITEIEKGTTGNFNLYASWGKYNYYNIHYYNVNSSEHHNPTEYSVESDEITLSSAERNGYAFKGWYKDEACTQEITSIPKGSFGNLDIYAKWEVTPYTITYHNVELSEHNNPTEYTVETNTINLSSPTAREKFKFKSWYKDEACTQEITSIPKGTSGNLDIYAKWLDAYTITYNNLLGSTTDNPTSYTSDDAFTLKDPVGDTGYVFTGWRLDSTAGELITEIEKGTTGNLNLYACWGSPVTYTITYANVSSSEHNNPSTYTIDKLPLTLNAASRVNWTFEGWYFDSAFTNKTTTIPEGTVGNITIYAKMVFQKNLEECTWEEIKTVSEAGTARDSFGEPGAQTKKVQMSDQDLNNNGIIDGNETYYTIRIIDYGRDLLSSSTEKVKKYAGITFEFANVIDGITTIWNSGDNNHFDHSTIYGRFEIGGDVYKKIATISDASGNLVDFIKTVEKDFEAYWSGAWHNDHKYDTKLFPLSRYELNGDKKTSYQYYKGASDSKRIKDNTTYWLRSPDTSTNSNSWSVNASGAIDSAACNSNFALAPAFCI